MAELKNSLKRQDRWTSRVCHRVLQDIGCCGTASETHSALKIGSSGPNLNDTRVGKIKRRKFVKGCFKVWFRLPSGLLRSIIKIRCAVNVVPSTGLHGLPPPGKDTQTQKGICLPLLRWQYVGYLLFPQKERFQNMLKIKCLPSVRDKIWRQQWVTDLVINMSIFLSKPILMKEVKDAGLKVKEWALLDV